ncbi:hypothetical protein ACFIOY_18595 [Bradyrhizobium sp. TZ2]
MVTTATELTSLGIQLTDVICDLEQCCGIKVEMDMDDASPNRENVRDILEAVRRLLGKNA